MYIDTLIAGASIICLLGGCAMATSAEPDAGYEDAAPASSAMVCGRVEATFTIQEPEQCRPLHVPLTFFLTAAFDLQTLRAEEATAVSETECVHQQLLDAPADAWASFAHSVLCGGGGDFRLCGELATRACAVEQLMLWADPQRGPVAARDRTFAFEYASARPRAPSCFGKHDCKPRGSSTTLPA